MPKESSEARSQAFANIYANINSAIEVTSKRADISRSNPSDFDPRSLAALFATELTQNLFHGRGYYFIFRSGAAITNVQYSELTAQLSKFSTFVYGGDQAATGPTQPRTHCQFHSTNEVREALEGLWLSLVPDIDHAIQLCNPKSGFIDGLKSAIKAAYASIAATTIVLDCLENSAIVFLPNTLTISLRDITIRSGYVISSGKLVYARNTEKSSIQECISSVEKYLAKRTKKSPPFAFCLYASEIFDQHESEMDKRFISGGLENLKFSGVKNYFGGIPLYSFRERLTEKFRDTFRFIGGNKDFRSQILECDGGTKGVFWLVKDRKLSNSRINRPSDDLYIIYHQRYRNDDISNFFDEDKPGWIAPVTWPHSLTSAMLSLTLDRFGTGDDLIIVDPFVGSGTSLIEALKKYPNCSFWGADLAIASREAIKDNVNIFSSPAIYRKLMGRLKDALCDKAEFSEKYSHCFNATHPWQAAANADWLGSAIQRARQAVSNVLSNNGVSADLDSFQRVRLLSEADFGPFIANYDGISEIDSRVVFYYTWKVISKNSAALVAGQLSETEKLHEYLTEFLRVYEDLSVMDSRTHTTSSIVERETSVFGRHLAFDYRRLRSDIESCIDRIEVGSEKGSFPASWDALIAKLDGRKPDIVIMDPPYGFNTDRESISLLSTLYSDLIDRIVRDSGQETHVLMCLPERSHNGQVIPSFVTKDWVVPKLFEAAAGRVDVVQYSNVRPGPANFFRAPFYWRSEKALTRSVLHFVLQKKDRS
jgi:tRNA G10  N-methylase Trm11